MKKTPSAEPASALDGLRRGERRTLNVEFRVRPLHSIFGVGLWAFGVFFWLL